MLEPEPPRALVIVFFVLPFFVTLGAAFVVYAWAKASFPWLTRRPRRARVLAWAIGAFLTVEFAANWTVILFHSHTASIVRTTLVFIMTTVILAAVPIAAVRGAFYWAERKRGAASAASAASAAPAEPASAEREPVHPLGEALLARRGVIEGAWGVALFGATGTMLGWGMTRGRHAYEMTEVPVKIPGLPRALDGYAIVQISDLHAGDFVGAREFDAGLSVVRAARPDLLVVTGDIVDFDPAYAPGVARRLVDLGARDGVVAIPGNHDYYAGADAVIAALRAGGVDVLRDAGRVIRAGDGGGFALLGVDDLTSVRHGREGPRLDRALAAVPPDLPRILLSHQPASVDRWAGQVALQLSGHTHGGQINPGGFSPLSLLLKYIAGTYEVPSPGARATTTLYVNRGFGTVGAPSRVGAPPEITRVILVSA